MKRRRFLTASMTVLTLVTFMLTLPILLNSNALDSICTLPKVNAQDNPCLAQESTLAVLGLQATLDGINYQSTISAMGSTGNVDYSATITYLETELAAARASGGGGSTDGGSAPVLGLPFTETFDNTDRGWDLSPRETGVARFSQGQLLISATPGFYYGVQIPGVSSEQIYVELDMTNRYTNGIPCFNDQFIGFMLGNRDSEGHYLYVVGFDEVQDGCSWAGQENNGPQLIRANMVFWSVRLYQVGGNGVTILSQTDYETPIWETGQLVTLALEGRNSTFTLFLNGTQLETTQLSPNGDQVSLVVFAPDTGRVTNYYADRADNVNYEKGASALFDNLVARQSREG